MPVNQIPLDVIRRILEGGESVCARAGIPIAGGHSIDSVEPIYGLVAIGLVDPRNLKRNAGAKPGDKLVLGKPLGVGIFSAALKTGKLVTFMLIWMRILLTAPVSCSARISCRQNRAD